MPRDAPVTLRAALGGMYLVVALCVIALITSLVFDPQGGIVLEYLLLAAVFVAVAVQIARRRTWARYVAMGLAVFLALTTFSLFQKGVPGIVQAVGALQLLVYVGIVVLLVMRRSGDWFRPVR